MFRRAVVRTAGAAAIGAAAYYATTTPLQREAVTRFCRTAYTGARIAYEYKYTVGPVEAAHGKDSDEYRAIRSTVDTLCARAMLDLCRAHGGLFTKMGQYLSTLNYALPKEYTSTLSAVQDKASFRPFEDVKRVLEAELGAPVEALFQEIDDTPIAAASLAQVHRAVLRTPSGPMRVAVKVQYPDLSYRIWSDMEGIRLLLHVMEWMFPDYGYTWLLPEFEASLRNELNFLQEAHNAERVSAMFAWNKRVHVPAIVRDMSSARVLVMEFIDGCKVSDHAALQKMRVPEQQVASEISRVFGDMIHVHGFVHCDPHPGNLMVRQHPTLGWQLVVLDHGMYRRLTPQFRAAYCRLWKALVTRDHNLGRRATIELGLNTEHYDALSLALTYRPADSSAGLGKGMSKQDVDRLKREYKDVNAGDINRFMQRLPRDMLFVMRSTNMIRSLNMELGGTSRQRFQILGESAVRGLILTDAMEDFSTHASEFLKAGAAVQKAENASLVSDIADSSASSGEESGWDLMRRFIARLGAPPPQEPVTYINALSNGSLLNQPTESELQRAGGASSSPSSVWRGLRLAKDILMLRARLAFLDAVFAFASWRGQFEPHVDKQHPRVNAG